MPSLGHRLEQIAGPAAVFSSFVQGAGYEPEYGNEYDYGYGGGYEGYGGGYGYDDYGYGGEPYGDAGAEDYGGGEYLEEESPLISTAPAAPSHKALQEAPSQDYGVIDQRLGKGKDPALGPDIVDGLREVHDKIKDVREALNLYRIVKADGSRAMQQLERMPRQMPGGVPWASALDLEHVVEKTKFIPSADFDNLIDGMHEMQVSLDNTLRNYLMKKAAAHEAARESMNEAAQAAREAADLIRGANPDAMPVPEMEEAGPTEVIEDVAPAEPGEALGPVEAEELSEELGIEVPPDATLEDLPALNDMAELNHEGVDLEREREMLYSSNINDELS